ncbi:uncharacterized protein N7518_003536 [Penicillium psychrosexuale]|uniref:uncharacterized protein n=1 Tax=Penicillium psychrosexuale TaxID=1002107 RepID=UPI0025457C66|nr:uncharacterized protein N7518_003536 [Penicillium psychrosexuale]KAJ5801468.1 hypothetical protein N7518_003536 [Penicillium psychrosexuale]
MLSVLTSNPTVTLTPEPLTAENFAPFGTAVVSPLPRELNIAPESSCLPPHNPTPVLANQNSALKYSPISPLIDRYTNLCPSGQPSEARMTMFCCFPRVLRTVSGGPQMPDREVFDVRILERHPFTNQTFIPVDLSAHSKVGNDEEEPLFLIVVAPTLKWRTATAENEAGETVTIRDPPDLNNIKAFVARAGQAVTYGVGTWHAPMVVLGHRRIDFVVVQFVNGVGSEDCQEVAFKEGLVVDLGREGQHGRIEKGPRLWSPKL